MTRIALKAVNGKYVSAQANQPVIASASQIGPTEIFEVYNLGNNKVALIGKLGIVRTIAPSQLLSLYTDLTYRPPLSDRDNPAQGAVFTWVDLGNNKIGLLSNAGSYVCAENTGSAPLVANRTARGDWETFSVVPIAPDSTGTSYRPSRVIALQCYHGGFVCADNAGNAPLIPNRTAAAEWETFVLDYQGGSQVSLQAVNEKFVSLTADQRLCASSAHVGPNETFQLRELGGGKIALLASNGCWVCAESNAQTLVVNRATPREWETFALLDMVMMWQDWSLTLRWIGNQRFVRRTSTGSLLADAGDNSPSECRFQIDRSDSKFRLRSRVDSQYLAKDAAGNLTFVDGAANGLSFVLKRYGKVAALQLQSDSNTYLHIQPNSQLGLSTQFDRNSLFECVYP
jgi:hypothetical protein